MPNHVKNRLEFKGSKVDIAKVFNLIKGEKKEDEDERLIDFNKIIPMPKELNIDSSSTGELAQALLFNTGGSMFLGKQECIRRFSELSPERKQKEVEAALRYQGNIDKYGHSTWYGWCPENWGTKWNAYGISKESGSVILFNTAWNSVVKLIGVLASRFPSVEICYEWADEDIGYNVGMCRYKNGNIDELKNFEEGSREAYDMSFKIRPEYKEDYKLINNNYVHIEDD